jgi:endonuclease III
MSSPSVEEKQRAAEILLELKRLYPDARCALNFTSALELLVATILAAQCTDERVNQVTATLFKKYPTAAAYASSAQEELEQDVKSTGFYRNKAKSVRAMAQMLVDRYGGEVPRTMDELTALPGVARKTANVVLGNAYNIVVGIAVDTHMLRLARRFGWTTSEDPVQVERDVMPLFPQGEWVHLSHLIQYHGRAVCRAPKPLCESCTLVPLCPTGQARLAAGGAPAPVATKKVASRVRAAQ